MDKLVLVYGIVLPKLMGVEGSNLLFLVEVWLPVIK